jgi:hypothetical protein
MRRVEDEIAEDELRVGLDFFLRSDECSGARIPVNI